MQKSAIFQNIVIVAVCSLLLTLQNSCGLFGFANRIAREKLSDKNVETSQSSNNPKPVKGSKIRRDRPFADFQSEILADFQNENFARLDEKAAEFRRTKERFPGGYWKLSILYGALTEIFTDGAPQTEEMWATHLEKLKKWKGQMPNSITARVALAKSYIQYGWFARGAGFSRTVADSDMNKLHERLELAYEELKEAERLVDKCPQWYETMLFLAMAQSWNADEYDALFAEAVNFEPNYYYFYYDKATNSLPRWGGRKGDWERFAVELENLDSKERDAIYFLYVSNMVDNYYAEWSDRQSISWERCKRGYKELEAAYGADKQRLNQYALLAAVNEDMPEAYNAFKKIGDDWDDEVFSEARFREIKTWAIARYEAENRR